MSWRIAALLGALSCSSVWSDDLPQSVPLAPKPATPKPATPETVIQASGPAPVAIPPSAALPIASPPIAAPQVTAPQVTVPKVPSAPTHVDANLSNPTPPNEAPIMVVLRVQHANATDVSRILQGVTDPKEFRAVQTADPRTNSIILRGSIKEIETLRQMIDQLDIAPSDLRLPVNPYLAQTPQALPYPYPNPLMAQLPTVIASVPAASSSFSNKQMAEYNRLDEESTVIAKAYREGKKTLGDGHPQQQDRRATLAQLVNGAFQIRQEMQANELKQLKDRIAKVEQAIATRSKNRTAIIEKRIQELLLEDAELNWNPGESARALTQRPSPAKRRPGFVGDPNSRDVSVYEPMVMPAPIANSQFGPTPQVTSATAPLGVPMSVSSPLPVPNAVHGGWVFPKQSTTPATAFDLSELPTGAGQRRAYLNAKALLQQREEQVAAWKSRLKSGEAESSLEYRTVVRELQTARSQMLALQREMDAQESLLRLDLEAAESALHAATDEYDQQTQKWKQGVDSADGLPRLRGAMEQQRARLERAKILLQLHKDTLRMESASAGSDDAAIPPPGSATSPAETDSAARSAPAENPGGVGKIKDLDPQ